MRVGLALLIYAALFAVFDVGATAFEVAPGVSPWYPSAGLHLSLLLLLGARYAPAVFLASVASGIWISDPAIPLSHLVLPNAIIAAAHGTAAAGLRRHFQAEDVFSIRAALWFCGVALLVPSVIAVLSVWSYAWTGLYGPDAPLTSIMLGWWVGDAVGILTVTPLILLVVFRWVPVHAMEDPERSLSSFRVEAPGNLLRFLGEFVALGLVLLVAFAAPLGDRFPFYLCFLPLLWIALRNGLPRTCLATAAVNLSAAVTLVQRGQVGDLLPFQFFMLAFALTGISLGVLVSQRRRAVYLLQEAERTLEQRLERYASHLGDRQRDAVSAKRAQSRGETRSDSDAPDTTEDVLRQSTENLIALNQTILDSEESLLELSDQKDRFLSIISHDLKTPLFGIRGLSDVLSDQADDDRQRHLLGLIHRSANQALTLLENLLTWARLQTGSLSTDPRPLALAAAVDDSFQLLDSHAQQKGIDLAQDVPDSLEVSVDEFTLDTVLRNLVSNAIKYTPRGGRVHVSAQVEARDESPDNGRTAHAVVAVSDSGIGIAAERRASLFDLNPEDSTAGTNGENGTGLGLHVCQELLAKHGREISVESTPGTGSIFSFSLPVSSPAQEAAHRPASSTGADGTDASSESTISS